MSSFSLLKEKRFGPIFFTQFLGAFNDNVFKNALLIILTYKAVAESEAGLYANLAAGLFILPFFLFSPLAGQFCDKYEKSKLIRYVKMLEIVLMSIGALGFYLGNVNLLFVSLFLMGTQSAFFGPAKYSILPQHLKEDELVAGNSLVEMGTFLAILTGTILAGLIIKYVPSQIGVVTVAIAFLGYLTSCAIPKAPSTDPALKIDWNLFRETIGLHKMCKKRRSVYLGVIGISWFWFIGSIILVQLPSLTKYFLHGDETVVTLLLAVFSLSIGLGAYICERISKDKIELGLVMLGSIGLSIFTIDIFCIDFDLAERSVVSISEIFKADVPGFYRLLLDIMMLGIFGSLYIVPLYALIQQKAEPKYRSRVIAYNNILNALFMVGSAIFCMAVFTLGSSVPAVFLMIGVANVFVAFYIFLLIPEFFLKLVFWLLTVTVYSVRYTGRDKIPEKGGCVVISNHVSFIDWAFIAAAAPRPMRFVMDYEYWKIKPFTYMFKAGKCIPICTSRESQEIKEMAFQIGRAHV